MGVAERVRQSTPTLIFLRCSLAWTPKRCSSSMMIRPRSLNCDIFADDAVGADEDIDCAVRDSFEGFS